MASFFANFASILQYTDERGVNMIRLQPLLNEQSVKGLPVPTGMPLTSSNAYPSPGMAQHPQPFTGPYPRVTREPR